MTRLLVADDSETILLLLKRRLALEGYEVETAGGGQAVLDILNGSTAASSPDVIVLDAMMPGKSGLDVLRELRQGGNSTPVLIVSAHRQADDMHDAVESGANGCLTKPIDWDELTSKIDQLAES
jgi:DNA-binding response OmpR family regulator